MASVPGPAALLRYVGESKAFVGAIVALFLVSLAAGYALPGAAPDTAEELVSGIRDKAVQLSSQPAPVMLLGIFANNAIGALAAMLLGLAAGLFPLLFTVTNGLVVGIVLETTMAKLGAGTGILVFLAGILPHGIFELPAILLATAIGLKLGCRAVQSVVRRRDLVSRELVQGVLIFLFWIAPMLLVAAAIETLVTGRILGLLFGTA